VEGKYYIVKSCMFDVDCTHTMNQTAHFSQPVFVLLIIINKDISKFWEELVAYFPFDDMEYIENVAPNSSSIVSY
jgi:hypothetical protein